MAKRKYEQPKALYLHVTADIEGVDLEIKIVRGGKISLELYEDASEGEIPFRIELPGGLMDQCRWVSDARGMRPLGMNEKW